MKNLKAVIFDMDGVIVDSEELWKQAEKEIFSALGVIVTDEYAGLTKSMTTSEVTKFWYDKFPWQDEGLDVVEQMVVSRVIELLGTEDCLINGVKEFIEKNGGQIWFESVPDKGTTFFITLPKADN